MRRLSQLSLILFIVILSTEMHAQESNRVSLVDGYDYKIKSATFLKEKKRNYPIINVKNLDLNSVWCEGQSGQGIGEQINIVLKSRLKEIELDSLEIMILPGYAKSARLFRANSRPSVVTIRVIDSESEAPLTIKRDYKFNLKDSPELQIFSIKIGRVLNPSKIGLSIKIDQVYKGSKHEDTCITELRILSKEKGRSLFELKHEEWDILSNEESKYIVSFLPIAMKGDWEVMQRLIRMVNGAYITGVEGSEWLGEIYLDLLVKHPYKFLQLLTRQDNKTRRNVVKMLTSPVNDKYSSQNLRAAIVKAKKKGVDSLFANNLMRNIK